jgi:ABC-type polysaccharide/polyol phosphate export permease
MSTSEHLLKMGRHGLKFEAGRAVADLVGAYRRFNLALALAWHDVLGRYRGSVLGPFWITLSLGAQVLGIGLLYARLFKLDVSDFLPFVAVSLVLWSTISGIIIEGCSIFIEAGGILRQTALPMFVFPLRATLRALINLGHNMIIVLAVLIWRHNISLVGGVLSLLGFCVVLANVTWVAMLAAIVSARFRDVPPIINAAIMFSMFMTPIFWKPNQVGRGHALLEFNPFYYMFDAVRSPLLGEALNGKTWPLLGAMAVVGWAITFAVFTGTRRRIVHYL